MQCDGRVVAGCPRRPCGLVRIGLPGLTEPTRPVLPEPERRSFRRWVIVYTILHLTVCFGFALRHPEHASPEHWYFVSALIAVQIIAWSHLSRWLVRTFEIDGPQNGRLAVLIGAGTIVYFIVILFVRPDWSDGSRIRPLLLPLIFLGPPSTWIWELVKSR